MYQSHARAMVLLGFLLVCQTGLAQESSKPDPQTSDVKSLNVLFIGNSYTARHNLAEIVKQMAESSHPGLSFNPTQVIYGGRTLRDHWRLGTQHIVNRWQVTAEQVKTTISGLESKLENDPQDKYGPSGIKRMKALLHEIENGQVDRTKWDLIVLQSYRDDLEGGRSLYMEFVPKFVSLANRQDARVLLYETTPTTQNQFPIAQHSDSKPVLLKAKEIANLARQNGALVAPMSYVALQCQIGNPELTLRFENDAHLNQTMAYLTACTIYAAVFDRTPEGLELDSVTDIRFLDNDRSTGKDRDGKPITKVFSDHERAFLQATAWEALQEFKERF